MTAFSPPADENTPIALRMGAGGYNFPDGKQVRVTSMVVHASYVSDSANFWSALRAVVGTEYDTGVLHLHPEEHGENALLLYDGLELVDSDGD